MLADLELVKGGTHSRGHRSDMLLPREGVGYRKAQILDRVPERNDLIIDPNRRQTQGIDAANVLGSAENHRCGLPRI